MLNDKQEQFCKEYIIDSNATQAYIRAGYSPKGANSLSARMMANDSIQTRIAELMREKDAALIAKADEILQYLTAVLRGESKSTVVVVEGQGDGESRARNLLKAPDEKERLKAAELLGKRHGLFTENHKVDVSLPVIMDDVGCALADQQEKAENSP